MKTQIFIKIIHLYGILLFCIPVQAVHAQDTLRVDTLTGIKDDSMHVEDLMIDGEIVEVIIEGDDTLLLSTFDEISVTSKRFFCLQ